MEAAATCSRSVMTSEAFAIRISHSSSECVVRLISLLKAESVYVFLSIKLPASSRRAHSTPAELDFLYLSKSKYKAQSKERDALPIDLIAQKDTGSLANAYTFS
ncbi:hypothetical protein SDC9_185651 [bioreactor metagenome]|uniref:Uncharacterized protein n=1 Tax=bioreactor metagenome TaxID=1076179 RepID=A0A645HGP6_9ZZZZ